jgi:hypothetical protein
MANKSLLTYNAKVTQVEQDYFAPVAYVQNTQIPISTLYCFLSRVANWPSEINPPEPTQDQKAIKSIFKNIFVVKKVNSANISPVAQRFDWTFGQVYDYYQDTVDMFERDATGLVRKFYIRNKYDQVFKCLWNNNGVAVTDEPFFQPGSYGTNNIYKGTDGYKWKYIYTIDVGRKTKFMDDTWIPVPVGDDTPNPIANDAGFGDIEVINVINGGSGYDPANAALSVVVSGDGTTTAVAEASITNGVITDITLTNTGSNYTYANVYISSTLGSNSSFIAPISPIGGHGFDPISELGVKNSMVTVEFNGSENGMISTDIDYRQVGLLVNPVARSTYPYPANGSIYKTTTDLITAPGFGTYQEDETVYQGPSLAEATFTATVLIFDAASNVLQLINTTGTPTPNAPIFGNDSLTARTVLNVSNPDFVLFSGYLMYVENREPVQRSFDGIEQFKFVLGY